MIYTTILPKVVHGQNCTSQKRSAETDRNGDCGPVQRAETAEAAQVPQRPLYKTGNSKCGALVCFADNSSECVSDHNINKLKISMEQHYAYAAYFLTFSMLQVNSDKTHAMLLTVQKNKQPQHHSNLWE